MSDVLAERIEAITEYARARRIAPQKPDEVLAVADAVLREHANEAWWCVEAAQTYPFPALEGRCGLCGGGGCGPRLVVDPAWLARGGDDAD